MDDDNTDRTHDRDADSERSQESEGAEGESLTRSELLRLLKERDDERDRKWAAQLRRAQRSRPQSRTSGADDDTDRRSGDRDDADDDADHDTDGDEGARDRGRNKRLADRRVEDELRRLRKEQAELKAEREREREERAKERREADLRRFIEQQPGVLDVEAVFRYVVRDLTPDEDGRLVAETRDGVVTADEYVTQTIEANAWMRKPSGREGGGGAERGRREQGGGSLKWDDKLSPAENLRRARRAKSSGTP